ncbi:hypothetical protein O181_014706 [Austropuccinia psidii MF-1]|uniref:Uncharacterized protein n=1 Tax=Austropuccinia psidii MF-1 TaxID=1389203 RepID=A0A9Q3BYL7_9BASI|nr:hypothetical protein [Austropuccinia psidii MF-1]
MSCKEKIKKMKNYWNNQILLSIEEKKELDMIPDLEKEGTEASTSSRTAQRQAQGTAEQAERSHDQKRTGKARPIGTDLTHKGMGFPTWILQLWKAYSRWPGLL